MLIISIYQENCMNTNEKLVRLCVQVNQVSRRRVSAFCRLPDRSGKKLLKLAFELALPDALTRFWKSVCQMDNAPEFPPDDSWLIRFCRLSEKLLMPLMF